jgi:hypothetical protein
MNDSLHLLLYSLIDYAGLFPPSALPMPEAVENYARYRTGPHAFALGRFITPVARLDEFAAAAAEVTPEVVWPLSVLAGNDLDTDLAAIATFNATHAGRFSIDGIEVKGSTVEEIQRIEKKVPPELGLYFELSGPIERLLDVVARAGRRAKVRTGGVVAAAIPAANEVARFLVACAERHVPFKATAGLHHPVRCVKPLTYESDAPTGTMHGFMNVFLAATLVCEGAPIETAAELLADDDPRAFRVEPDRIIWRDQTITKKDLRTARQSFAISFGSCSFEEPLDDLRALGWM